VPARPDARHKRAGSRAGRNLPAAIAVGVTMAALALGSLFFEKRLFLLLAAAAIGIAVWELGGALRTAGIAMPRVPLLVGMVAMLGAGYLAGPGGLVLATGLTVVAVLLWRGANGPDGYRRDAAAGLFGVVYLLLAGGFAALLVRPEDGPFRILAWLLVVVGSDIGGYAVGVLAGRHPMAPSVSPKKSWEGFAGSVLVCVLLGTAVMVWALDEPWWTGVVLGLSVAVAATLGDLTESLLKRDIGVKDMGTLLPGHGGLMDRLDSIALSAPVAWLVLTTLAPPV
jgi:phosphatidate cytidylyltransferase